MVTACFYVAHLCLRRWRSNDLYLDSGMHLSCYEPSAKEPHVALDMTSLEKCEQSSAQVRYIFTRFIFKHTGR